jgi:hypothetical protein
MLNPTVGAIYSYLFYALSLESMVVFPELSRPITRILTFYFENAEPICSLLLLEIYLIIYMDD